jgi:hypothetical protein
MRNALVIGIAIFLLAGYASEQEKQRREFAAMQKRCQAQGKQAQYVPMGDPTGTEVRVWSQLMCVSQSDPYYRPPPTSGK